MLMGVQIVPNFKFSDQNREPQTRISTPCCPVLTVETFCIQLVNTLTQPAALYMFLSRSPQIIRKRGKKKKVCTVNSSSATPAFSSLCTLLEKIDSEGKCIYVKLRGMP